ncbi:MAG: LPS-assembly protein LptD [Gallionella sp.]|nr:LPS-assembly protein LptD [Gallionella sp.]MDD4945267.1 LPS-assembly protein LptD [Gallionella sp.]MDD5611794.1 LPS-assembly protein LptD [Gallionella sp.]
MRFRIKPVLFTLLCALSQSVAAEALRPLTAGSAAPTSQQEPVSVEADKLTGDQENQVEATGNAIMLNSNQTVRADRLIYDQQTGDVEGMGSVIVEQDGSTMSGPHLKLNMDTSAGFMEQPNFYLKENDSRGTGDILHIQDKQHYTLENATYTACPAGNQDWLMKMSSLKIDREEQVGVAQNARVEFMDVPILYTPWMDFPLSGQRKSGFLSPIIGGTNKGGSELTLPYYFNLAPNRDATVSPRLIAKRGLMLNNEFRYLEADYAGELHADVLPGDAISRSNRGHFSLKHSQALGAGFSAQVNFNRVSDSAYYRDLSDSMTNTSQVNLLQDAALNYSGNWWSGSARLQRFQTLQDPLAPIASPYARLPQLTLNAGRNMGGANVTFSGEYVSFSHATALNGQRLVINPAVSYPLVNAPGYYLTPKLSLHSTSYTLGSNNAAGLPNASRTLPMLSVDAGAVFERDVSLFGSKYLNTLEPRAYYVYVPYKDQSLLPVFDTAQAPFSYAQMFTENRFYGNDRVGDANQVTLAIISRFLGMDDGTERLKLMVAERFSLSTPRVNLVAPTTTTNKSDILLGASGRVSAAWSLQSEWQYSPSLARTQHFNLMARYRPETGKVLNLGFRYISDSLGTQLPGVITPTGSAVVNGITYPTFGGVPYATIGGNSYTVTSPGLRQINISGQWPLSSRWSAVGQWSYSYLDKRLLSGIAGVEYSQDCWTLRMVAHSFTVGSQQSSTGVFLQIELNELLKVGSDPLTLLKQSVPGYTKVNDKPASDNRSVLR